MCAFAYTPALDKAAYAIVGKDDRQLRMTLVPTRSYTGEVVKVDGTPCPGARVKLEVKMNGPNSPLQVALTQADDMGYFTIDKICPDAVYTVTIWSGAWDDPYKWAVPVEEEITMSEPLRVVVKHKGT